MAVIVAGERVFVKATVFTVLGKMVIFSLSFGVVSFLQIFDLICFLVEPEEDKIVDDSEGTIKVSSDLETSGLDPGPVSEDDVTLIEGEMVVIGYKRDLNDNDDDEEEDDEDEDDVEVWTREVRLLLLKLF